MKFLECYSKEPNIYIVEIEHLGEIFCGFARVHPNDQDIESVYAGYEIAEIRAKIAALKYERRLAKEKYKEYQNFVKACECYKNFDKDSATAHVVYRQLNREEKKIEKLTTMIDTLKESIVIGLKEREKILEKLRKIKKNKDKNN